MDNLAGKRFVYAIVAIICVTITSIWLKFDGKTYATLVGMVSGIFTISQAYTDVKGQNGKV